jgi:hypothetical protein
MDPVPSNCCVPTTVQQPSQPIIEEKHLVPTHQSGFRKTHSTIDQVHRITNIIEKHLKTKDSALLFLDIAQTFNTVGQFFPIISINY